ncbi:MAG: hypothetical protein GY795_11585 [Desulfobacterales bacterium]|nr:hypothetical protein [Desulfobacterales bacterium]
MIRNILNIRYVFAILFAVVFFAPTLVMAGPPAGNWWDVVPEDEVPCPNYDSILYSEIAPKLHEIDLKTDRMKVEVMGQSAGGRNLFLVIMSSAENIKWINYYKRFSRIMSEDPERALVMIDNGEDIKVPLFINGSIHGNEYEGTDACIRLIETLAFEDTEQVNAILDNTILLFNVCQNPDGRVLGTRENVNSIDLNRDFVSQTQPETRATVKQIREWNPLIFLDLHDDVDPMLIEPCTAPHNQNYEYDLYIKWALYQAEAMEAELMAQTGLSAQIPYRDWVFEEYGTWDDWPPIYTPMYAMHHGAFGHTLETPYEDERGVDADYAAVWGAFKFVVENKRGMLQDHINIFWRGNYAKPQKLISEELLAEAPSDQFNEFTIKEFPTAYVIPADGSAQLSPHQPAELVEYLIFNGVEVEKATESFTLDAVEYPAGTYIVWLDQPKRGLANVILEDGPDVSELQEGMVFYSPPTAWSIPLMMGVHRVVMEEKTEINTVRIRKAVMPEGSVETGSAGAYAYLPTTVAAIKATNNLLAQGATVYRSEKSFEDSGRTFGPGTFIIPADSAIADRLAQDSKLEIFALSNIPGDAVLMKKQRIAVCMNFPNALRFTLSYLGFDNDIVTTDDLNSGKISEYDLFININRSWDGLSEDGKASLTAFFENSGDYIGATRTGVSFGADAGLMNVVYQAEGPDCILNIDYVTGDPLAAGFREDSHAMAIGLTYFTDIPENAKTTASVDSGDFLVSGFWPGWQDSGAKGMPIIVHETTGSRDVTLMGINPVFRGYPKNTYRLLANAIYNSLE